MADTIDEMYKDGRISEHTYYLINKVKERKIKKERYKKLLYFFSLLILILCGVTIYCLFEGVTKSGTTSLSINAILQNSFFTKLILFFIGVYVIYRFVSKKYQDVDKDFEKLRIEMIERSRDLWPYHYDQDNEGQVYQIMKQDYDINLFHK